MSALAPAVTVGIPVKNGGEQLAGTLTALARQTVPHELIVLDSGSTDGSPALARRHNARVIEGDPERFNHGAARNRLMREALGSHVALLTQDAEPASELWLERLLDGFRLAEDVAVVYGPYVPRPQASFAVRQELESWFRSLSPHGEPLVDRLGIDERMLPAMTLVGRRGFLTDANACVLRSAWERVPFREAAYAEDRVFAIDIMREGYAKAFVPQAEVLHSHDYRGLQQLRRCFDEWRGLWEVYGWRQPSDPRSLARELRGRLGQARGGLREGNLAAHVRLALLIEVGWHHMLRLTGALLGSRADMLPPSVTRALSLERRAGVAPLGLDEALGQSPESLERR